MTPQQREIAEKIKVIAVDAKKSGCLHEAGVLFALLGAMYAGSESDLLSKCCEIARRDVRRIQAIQN